MKSQFETSSVKRRSSFYKQFSATVLFLTSIGFALHKAKRCKMKLLKNLSLAILIPTLVLNSAAWAQEVEPNSVEKTSKVQKLLNSATDQIKTMKLEKSFEIFNYQNSGFNSQLSSNIRSETSLGNKYSGVDVYRLNLSYVPSTFGSSGIVPSASMSTEVTFIQQFEGRVPSVVRRSKNPLSHLPVNSERALSLKPGDFVAFRAPMTFSLGKSFSELFTKQTVAHLNLSVFTVGEFDVHVFRMPDNRVRVKLFALREKGVTASVGLHLFAPGTNIALRLLSLDPGSVFVSKNKSELFSVDYIFNLNDKDAIEQYDQVMGQKYAVSGFKALNINPFASDARVKDLLYSDLNAVQNISLQDHDKPTAERRIIRLSMGENETDSLSRGMKINLKAIKAQITSRDSESKVSIYNVEDQKKNYLLNTQTKELNAQFFWLWGAENRQDSGLLVRADNNFNPTDILGLQSHRAKKELNLSRDEFEALRNKLNRTLPKEITETIQWPAWPSDRKAIKNARIEQDIFFNALTLQTMNNLTASFIQSELRAIIKSMGKIDSLPSGVTLNQNMNGAEDGDSFRAKAYKKQDYLAAFEYELTWIPDLYVKLLNENEPIKSRMAAYEQLQNIALFNEIGATLTLKLIPANRLKDTISFRFLISGKHLEGKQTYYPSIGHQENMNVFLNVVANNTYITDRSYNLGFYLNEKGDAYSLDELIAKAR